VIFNRDPSRADYALEAIERTTNPVIATEGLRYRFTLFNRAGNAIYSTSPHKFSNAINNVCMVLADKGPKTRHLVLHSSSNATYRDLVTYRRANRVRRWQRILCHGKYQACCRRFGF
jgi:hypothetical protein